MYLIYLFCYFPILKNLSHSCLIFYDRSRHLYIFVQFFLIFQFYFMLFFYDVTHIKRENSIYLRFIGTVTFLLNIIWYPKLFKCLIVGQAISYLTFLYFFLWFNNLNCGIIKSKGFRNENHFKLDFKLHEMYTKITFFIIISVSIRELIFIL